MRDNPVSENTHAVWAMPERPVKETVAADRIIFALSEREEAQTALTPVVISSAATRGNVKGELMRSANSARTEKRITKPPTSVMVVKLSMIELLTEEINGGLFEVVPTDKGEACVLVESTLVEEGIALL